MTNIKSDLVDSHEVTQTVDGIIVRRSIDITGMTGAASEMVYKALQDSRIPRRGNPHPTIPNMIADEIITTASGPDSARVTVIYRSINMLRKFRRQEPGTDPEGTIAFNFGTVATNTLFDNEGSRMSVRHEFTRTDDDGNTVRTEASQGVSVDIEIPVGGFDVTREENSFPRRLADTHRATVNRSHIWGYQPRTLLCKGITGYSQNGGRSFSVTYSFEVNKDTYDATIAFIDPETNAPPEDLKKGIGLKTVRVYPETDFRLLNLFVPVT